MNETQGNIQETVHSIEDEWATHKNFTRVREALEIVDDDRRSWVREILFWNALWSSDRKFAENLLNDDRKNLMDCDDNRHPIQGAIEKMQFGPNSGERPDVVEWLLDHEATVEAARENFENPLHSASTFGFEKVLALLIEHGADVNRIYRSDGRWTPLMCASAAGKSGAVALLLRHGADASIVSFEESYGVIYNRTTARELALQKGYDDIVNMLDKAARAGP
ncbi:MAG: ankyrin repeat domain-containing protein [Planctomycetota bacterium]|nr:ankyrin repeat domain-containing protein [Planctomycetota bacterium]MDA1211378.1 ankyrin repeat domain-containing protein [Planctomycetota bacterium]